MRELSARDRPKRIVSMRREQTPMSPAALLDHGLNLSVVKPLPRTSPVRNRAAESYKRVYGLAHIAWVTTIYRNDAGDWLVKPSNDDLLSLGHALKELAESSLGLYGGHSGAHNGLLDYCLASDQNNTRADGVCSWALSLSECRAIHHCKAANRPSIDARYRSTRFKCANRAGETVALTTGRGSPHTMLRTILSDGLVCYKENLGTRS